MKKQFTIGCQVELVVDIEVPENASREELDLIGTNFVDKHAVFNIYYEGFGTSKDMDAEIVDYDVISHDVQAIADISHPDNILETERGLTIGGQPDVLKESIEAIRSAFDGSGNDMPKALHDLVFTLETRLGLIETEDIE